MDAGEASVPTIGSGRLRSLPRLRWTRAEVERAARFFPQAQVLLGPQASEPALQTLARTGTLATFGILHLATHALADADRPEHSALILAQTGLPDPLTALLKGQPLYDGVITAADIARSWRLRSDLVTLSACGTGLGRKVAGEGILGLAHAFFQAGSRSLLVSLWEVDDEATSSLMARFYGNWIQRGMTKADALREAKLWLRGYEDATGYHPYEHPYHWAAFVLLGDGS
jgi:CHAT domain-containing protein